MVPGSPRLACLPDANRDEATRFGHGRLVLTPEARIRPEIDPQPGAIQLGLVAMLSTIRGERHNFLVPIAATRSEQRLFSRLPLRGPRARLNGEIGWSQ